MIGDTPTVSRAPGELRFGANGHPELETDQLAIWAEVDLGCVRRNVARLKRMLQPGTRLLAVVKANGYGHGEVEVARAVIGGGADWLGVARVEEGAALRRAGIDRPILLLAEPPLSALPSAAQFDLTPTVYSKDAVRAWAALGSDARRLPCHLKVDTGMHRYGVAPEAAEDFVDLIGELEGVELQGIWTHFAVAEEITKPLTALQNERFASLLSRLGPKAQGLIRHASNSAGTLTFPAAHLDMVRTGIAVYGIYPSPELADRVELEPAMTLKSRVNQVKRLRAGDAISYGQRYTLPRDAVVATIPCGYADGLRRNLSNLAHVLIRGRRYPICGTITMDHFLVDAGDDDIRVGDQVVIFGRQADREVPAQELADHLGTIPYEIVCGVSSRVRRVYLDSGDAGLI